MFDVLDEAILDAPPSVVFQEFLSLGSGGAAWWLPYLRAEPVAGDATRVGGRMWLHVQYGPKVLVEIREVIPDRLIRKEYIAGAFLGSSRLTFDPVPQGTHVRYHWVAQIADLRWRMVNRVFDFQKAHSRLVQHGFYGLAAHLRRRQ